MAFSFPIWSPKPSLATIDSMKVRLLIIAGRHAGRQFEFKEHQTFLAGRAPYAHLRFPDDDPYFSRTHFLLELNPPHCRLVDLGSTNGTRVNGHQVHEIELKDGDVIEAGETKILIVIPTPRRDEASSVTPAATLVAEVDLRTELPASPLPTDIDKGAPPAHGNRSPDAADELAGYRILRELGRGTFGVVYLAEKNDRQFAVKILLGDIDVNAREARRFRSGDSCP